MAKKAPATKGTAKSTGRKEPVAVSGMTKIDPTDIPVKGGLKTVTGSRSQLIDGEFRGDFTRDTFDPEKHYTRVLMQQGRVQLDADWNEQAAILLHYLQTLAADLIGPFGGPDGDWGFEVIPQEKLKNDFVIGKGHYYIDGVLCENERNIRYTGQLSSPSLVNLLADNKIYVVYLDVWERTISCIEDAMIREVALDGPDTAVRAKTEWMVRASEKLFTGPLGSPYEKEAKCNEIRQAFIESLPGIPSYFGRLKPDMNSDDRSDDICIIHPDTKYRGAENQLYRVEIHTGGTPEGDATFKWSRENGNVQFPILALNKNILSLGNLGRDDSLSLKPGNWVEIIDDDYVKQGYDPADIMETIGGRSTKIRNGSRLFEVKEVDTTHLTVTLAEDPKLSYNKASMNHPIVWRWDHTKPDAEDNCIAIVESGNKTEKFFELENGIRIQFFALPTQKRTIYVPGNYWLIPARVITGAIDWPMADDEYVALPPQGIIHGYAPLGIISVRGSGNVALQEDCRCRFASQLQRYCMEKK